MRARRRHARQFVSGGGDGGKKKTMLDGSSIWQTGFGVSTRYDATIHTKGFGILAAGMEVHLAPVRRLNRGPAATVFHDGMRTLRSGNRRSAAFGALGSGCGPLARQSRYQTTQGWKGLRAEEGTRSDRLLGVDVRCRLVDGYLCHRDDDETGSADKSDQQGFD